MAQSPADAFKLGAQKQRYETAQKTSRPGDTPWKDNAQKFKEDTIDTDAPGANLHVLLGATQCSKFKAWMNSSDFAQGEIEYEVVIEAMAEMFGVDDEDGELVSAMTNNLCNILMAMGFEVDGFTAQDIKHNNWRNRRESAQHQIPTYGGA